ncbi:MAG: hypothetical protein KatS3mg027_2492 [Bacteroidia bacterium]|nr:MAG: hypothetical protein KatS3mg027_2492 [Bacteroidia bacterium]
MLEGLINPELIKSIVKSELDKICQGNAGDSFKIVENDGNKIKITTKNTFVDNDIKSCSGQITIEYKGKEISFVL